MSGKDRRGEGCYLMSDADYLRKHVLGMYTPTIPKFISNRLRRRRRSDRGFCSECSTNEREEGRTRCRPCLDRHNPASQEQS